MRAPSISLTDTSNQRTVTSIQTGIVRLGKRNAAARFMYARDDQSKLATWKYDLVRVLHVLNVRSVESPRYPLILSSQTELAINTHSLVLDIHRNVMTGQEITQVRRLSVSMLSIVNQGQYGDSS